MKMRKKTIIWMAAGAAALLLLIAGCYLAVVWNASGRTYDNTADIPHNKFGLLLATSPITPGGARNFYFDNRIKAAVELYDAGKVQFIIASGGDYSRLYKNGCDEPRAIRDSLVARGIDADRILLDYEGTRTLNSIAKAKEVYGLESLTLISQKYHNERAIYLADRYGIKAVGYNAEPSPIRRNRIKNTLREYLARVRMFLDILTDRRPDIRKDTIDILSTLAESSDIGYSNSVKGHIERDTIVGNFTGAGIDSLYVYVYVDESYDNWEDRIKYYARSSNPDIPDIELYGCLGLRPSLVYEGDVDGDGKDEWGYLHTWTMSQWRQYRIYNYDASRKIWRHLFHDSNGSDFLGTDESFRGSGLEVVEKGPRRGFIKINYDSGGPDFVIRDTIVRATYTPITKDTK